MKAITVELRKPRSARLQDVPELDVSSGSILLEAIAVGVCETVTETVVGEYGWPRGGRRASCSGTNPLAA
jgi:hypothetical protein